MIKTIDNGVIRINGLSFLEFSNSFRGYLITNKKTGTVIPKFLLFWSGIDVSEVKIRFALLLRNYDN
jgi:hypothetical protein